MTTKCNTVPQLESRIEKKTLSKKLRKSER